MYSIYRNQCLKIIRAMLCTDRWIPLQDICTWQSIVHMISALWSNDPIFQHNMRALSCTLLERCNIISAMENLCETKNIFFHSVRWKSKLSPQKKVTISFYIGYFGSFLRTIASSNVLLWTSLSLKTLTKCMFNINFD